jgi:hypothetical protein
VVKLWVLRNAILFVHDRRDMQIFVRIHAADDATLYSFDDSHSQPPALTVHERLRRDRCGTGRSRDHMGSGGAESPCGASLANDPSLRESDQEPALID